MYPEEGPLRRELYVPHCQFFEAGTKYRERAIISANRIGKTEGVGGYELTCHLTGQYPDWWVGRRFTKPISAWAAGDTSQTVRDIIQTKLLGPPGEYGTGLIPGDLIFGEPKNKAGSVPDTVESITIKHVSRGISHLGLKSYDQKRKSFQGTEKDVIWLDEECDLGIYAECLLRTMTTDGLIICTFTPLLGLSETVLSFMPGGKIPDDFSETGKFVINATWDDAPHLTQQQKAELLASIPPYQRDARSKGIPQLGAGAIYPLAEEEIIIEPFELSPTFPKAYALDVGWNRCVAKDSMVLMSDGTYKAIQTIAIGEEVLAFDFKTENLIPTRVVDTFKGYASNMVTAAISEHQQITCTDDHPFAHRAAANDRIKFKMIKSIKNRIREFQSVVLPKKWEVENTDDICTNEMARIVGYLLGDGCLTYGNRRIEFAQTIQEYIDDMRQCLKSVGCKMRSYEDGKKHFLSGNSPEGNTVLFFVREIGLLGTNSSTKFIPSVFFKASTEVIKNLLVGLIHTDGSVDGDNVRVYTNSKEMANGVKTLCLRLGIYASISCDNRKRKATHNATFKVTLRRPYCLPLLAPKGLVPTRPERKKRADRLLSKYEKAKPQDIYCITVEHPDHAFICNGFVVSNTAALWGAWDQQRDIVYLYSEYYRGAAEPIIHAEGIKARGEWIPGVIDPAARGRSQKDGTRLVDDYVNLGLKLSYAVNAVEAGLLNVWQRLSTGKLKVFNSLRNFLAEYRIYRRDEKGNIVKENDHLMDDCRYLCMTGLSIAMTAPPEDWQMWDNNYQAQTDTVDNVTGY